MAGDKPQDVGWEAIDEAVFRVDETKLEGVFVVAMVVESFWEVVDTFAAVRLGVVLVLDELAVSGLKTITARTVRAANVNRIRQIIVKIMRFLFRYAFKRACRCFGCFGSCLQLRA
jgi:hypothetical protein